MMEQIATAMKIALTVIAIALVAGGQVNYNAGHKIIGICLAGMGTATLAYLWIK